MALEAHTPSALMTQEVIPSFHEMLAVSREFVRESCVLIRDHLYRIYSDDEQPNIIGALK